jgi:hypothetical protein
VKNRTEVAAGVLVSPARIERFLAEIVNTRARNVAELDGVLRRFPEFVPKVVSAASPFESVPGNPNQVERNQIKGNIEALLSLERPRSVEATERLRLRALDRLSRHGYADAGKSIVDDVFREAGITTLELALRLQIIWTCQDARERQWRIFELRMWHNALIRGNARWSVPELSPFEQAMVYLDRHADRFRFCRNPECPASYYIASTRKPTRYCSSKCAGPAKCAAKRKWWAEHRGKSKHGKSKKGGNR